MIKYEQKINPKNCFKTFSEGDVVTETFKNKKALGSLTYVTETSSKGKCYFKGKVLQGNPLRVSENARVSELNKSYFRRATNTEMNKIKKRFSF